MIEFVDDPSGGRPLYVGAAVHFSEFAAILLMDDRKSAVALALPGFNVAARVHCSHVGVAKHKVDAPAHKSRLIRMPPATPHHAVLRVHIESAFERLAVVADAAAVAETELERNAGSGPFYSVVVP